MFVLFIVELMELVSVGSEGIHVKSIFLLLIKYCWLHISSLILKKNILSWLH